MLSEIFSRETCDDTESQKINQFGVEFEKETYYIYNCLRIIFTKLSQSMGRANNVYFGNPRVINKLIY